MGGADVPGRGSIEVLNLIRSITSSTTPETQNKVRVGHYVVCKITYLLQSERLRFRT